MSTSEEDLIIVAATTLLLRKKLKCKRKKRFSVNPYLQLRATKGRFVRDITDMESYTPAFEENFHMTVGRFNLLLSLVEKHLSPKCRSRPDSISAKEKLCLTIEYLGSGTMQRHLASCYRVSKQRLGDVIQQTCEVLISKLLPVYLKTPEKGKWVEIANRFNLLWNLPNCMGSIDGKHVQIICPANSGSLFYNYKKYFSVVLMAVADADYRFIYYDVGAYGSEGDSTVFQDSAFGKLLLQEKLNLPADAPIQGIATPYFFIGDDAFPLHKRIMKPYAPNSKRHNLSVHQQN